MQEGRNAVAHDGFVLDTRLCAPLTDTEKAELQKLKAAEERRRLPEREAKRAEWSVNRIERFTAAGMSEDQARAEVNRCIDRQELSGVFELPFDDPKLAGTTVADVLAAPDEYTNKTLSDPFEGPAYGRGKAKLFRRDDGSLFVNSFAHGGITYELKALPNEVDAEIERLAKLPPLQYEQERQPAAKKLGIRTRALEKAVRAKRAELGLDAGDDGKQGQAISFPEPEPWPEPVDGAKLLDDIAKVIRRHVVMPDHACDTATLWAAHTYLLDHTMITPRLAIRSPVKGCGKTTLLDVLGQIVYRQLPAANCSASSIFRVVEMHRPCLLIDEADSFLSENEELRGVLNSGHRRGGSVLRTVGDDHEPRAFATYAACAIAMIGQLPGTLADRSVTIDLVRRRADEAIEPFRFDRVEHLTVLARKLVRWTRDNAEAIAATDPAMPAGLYNRAADNWRGTLSIATAAGGDWLARGHKAALAGAGPDNGQLELLLGDIRDTFGKQIEVSSADMVDALVALEGHPWAEMGRSGKPLTPNRLARMLKPLGIAPTMIGPETDRKRGYKIADFSDAFDRYLGLAPDSLHPQTPPRGDHNRTSVQNVMK